MMAHHTVAMTTAEGYHTPNVDAPLRIFLALNLRDSTTEDNVRKRPLPVKSTLMPWRAIRVSLRRQCKPAIALCKEKQKILNLQIFFVQFAKRTKADKCVRKQLTNYGLRPKLLTLGRLQASLVCTRSIATLKIESHQGRIGRRDMIVSQKIWGKK